MEVGWSFVIVKLQLLVSSFQKSTFEIHCKVSIFFFVEAVFNDLLRETGAKTVVWTALYEPWIMERDQMLKSKLESRGIKVRFAYDHKNRLDFDFKPHYKYLQTDRIGSVEKYCGKLLQKLWSVDTHRMFL